MDKPRFFTNSSREYLINAREDKKRSLHNEPDKEVWVFESLHFFLIQQKVYCGLNRIF